MVAGGVGKTFSDKSPDEIELVDILTKLIFDVDGRLSNTEKKIISLLGQLDSELENASRKELSEYLCGMGVDEMIQLVKQLKNSFCKQHDVSDSSSDQASPSRLH